MSDLSNVIQAIGKFAPVLANSIAPGAGSLISLIASTFGANKDDPQDLLDKINLSPDAAIKLKEIEANTLIQLHKMAADKDIAAINGEVSDRASAREMAVETKSTVPSILTYLLTCGFFVIMYCLFEDPIPSGNESTVYTLTGAYTTVYLMCISYWFGTTFASNGKDKMIYNSTPSESRIGDK